jgi:uncharacterized membrane protein
VAGGVAWFVYAFAGSLGYTAGPMVYNDAYNAAQSRLKDAGFPDGALRELGEHLDAGSSALITLVTADEAELVKIRLEQLGGVFIEHTLPAEVAAALTTPDAA